LSLILFGKNIAVIESMEILVIGDIIIDNYIIGECTRISPEAPVPVINVTKEYSTLGGAANVALNLAMLECECAIFGMLGKDENADKIKTMISENGIRDLTYIDIHHTTISKTRVISSNQQIVRVDREKLMTPAQEGVNLINSTLNSFAGSILVVSDYAKGFISEEVMREVRFHCSKNSKKLIIDPKGKNWRKYEGAYLIKPNFKELQEIVPFAINNTDEDIVRGSKYILDTFSIENVLVTRSEKGMTLCNMEAAKHFPTHEVEVYDVSGAGDTVIAVIADLLNQGQSLENAIKQSILASSYVVTKKGTYPIHKQELDRLSSK